MATVTVAASASHTWSSVSTLSASDDPVGGDNGRPPMASAPLRGAAPPPCAKDHGERDGQCADGHESKRLQDLRGVAACRGDMEAQQLNEVRRRRDPARTGVAERDAKPGRVEIDTWEI